MAQDCKKCRTLELLLAEAHHDRDQARQEAAELRAAALPQGDRDSLLEVNVRKANLVYILTGRKV